MRYCLSAVLLTACFELQVQPVPPKIEWQKCFGSSRVEYIYEIHQLADSGYILTGITGFDDGQVIGHDGGGICRY